ncbi:hypothetical protein BC941DRAFT_452556 [Chlamydoabsidia padenii]|nr:hypothetical protein BC941DRAFT_452556 [Chlamydoabsidia padenii]
MIATAPHWSTLIEGKSRECFMMAKPPTSVLFDCKLESLALLQDNNTLNNKTAYDRKHTTPNTELPKSTRDWSKSISPSILDLPLISRSSDKTDEPSLRRPELQIELWNEICQKTIKVKDPSDIKQWGILVDLLRKLREGVWASRWSEGNIRFAVKVYEESVHTRAREYPEFRKAIRGLVVDLYKLHEKGTNGHFLALDAIYQACHLQHHQEAMLSLITTSSRCYNEIEIDYAKQILEALSTHHWIRFFRLYYQAPHPAYHVILEPAITPLRRHALAVMQKAYYTAPLPWLASSLGFDPQHTGLVHSLHTLDTPNSIIDRIENDVLYFNKKRK